MMIHVCTKTPHPTRAHARDHLISLKRADKKAGDLSIYLCHLCDGWHVGHVKGRHHDRNSIRLKGARSGRRRARPSKRR